MKKVIAAALATLAIIIVALLVFAATKPDTFRIERATSIKAAPETIFAHLIDFHSWGSWSPWEKLDPTMQRTYSGAANGKGAVYEWKGNSEVGSGRMEIMESTPFSKISIKLDFIKPFEGHNTTEFTLRTEGEATNVTWAIHGPNQFLYCMRSPEGQDFWSTGVYREIVEPAKLDYTHSFADEKGNVVPATHYGMSVDFPLEMQMTVMFDAQEGKAKLTLHHAGVPAVMLELARAGWNESFDKLAESLK